MPKKAEPTAIQRPIPYSLPTEAQWEYAARAGTVSAFYNGDITQPSGTDPNLEQIGWYDQNSGSKTHPVAQKLANSFGLYDMSGNVYEWCQDWLGAYPDGPVIDPMSEPTVTSRAIRGGSWYDESGDARFAFCSSYTPGSAGPDMGFRLTLHTGQ